jgi:hypothetical protein
LQRDEDVVGDGSPERAASLIIELVEADEPATRADQ